MQKLIWLLLSVYSGIYLVQAISDPDIWWHIVVGRWILANHSVPTSDHWMALSAGMEWRAYSWLFEVCLALIESSYAIKGILIASLIMAALLALSFFYSTYKISNSGRYSILFGSLATIACFNHFTLRPQAISWAVFALIPVVLKISNSKLRCISCFFIFAFWSNIHLSSVFGLILLILWGYKDLKPQQLIFLALVAVLGTFATPYLGGEWLTMFETSSHPMIFSSITEFKPANILQYSTGFLIIQLVVLIYAISKLQLFNVKVIACFAFSALGLIAVKFLPFAYITNSIFLSLIWTKLLDKSRSDPLAAGIESLFNKFELIPKQGLSFLILTLIIVKSYNLLQEPLATALVAKKALDFVEQNSLSGPLMNTFSNGGYIAYRFSDDRGEIQQSMKPSIDGRTNLITREHWEIFNYALVGRNGWDEYIKQTKPETIIWRLESPLTQILLQSDHWCLVYDGARQLLPIGQEESDRNEFKDNSSLAQRLLSYRKSFGDVIFISRSQRDRLNLKSINCQKTAQL